MSVAWRLSRRGKKTLTRTRNPNPNPLAVSRWGAAQRLPPGWGVKDKERARSLNKLPPGFKAPGHRPDLHTFDLDTHEVRRRGALYCTLAPDRRRNLKLPAAGVTTGNNVRRCVPSLPAEPSPCCYMAIPP